jgi:hypothetical protein
MIEVRRQQLLEQDRLPGVVDAPSDMEQLLNDSPHGTVYTLRPVPLTAHEHDQFYLGFCNQII